MEYPVNSAEWHFQQILLQLGQDVNREGLQETPKRYVKFLKTFINPEKFELTCFNNDGGSEMIVQTDIHYYSLCEHHTLPFFGKATVAYIPNEKIVGLSKLARVVDLFSNQFQNQERITIQICEYLYEQLECKGVAVNLTGKHLCMCMRGVKKQDANTITNCFNGVFIGNEALQKQFLSFIK